MGSSLWLVTTRCTDPAREAEFNRWYDEVHLPDMLTVPHVVAARRYRVNGSSSESAPAQYLAIYELDTEEPEAVVQAVHREYVPRWQAANRRLDCLESLSSITVTALGARQQAPAATAGD